MNYTILSKIAVRFPAKPQKTSFKKEELIDLFQKRDYQEALFLSSPHLSDQFQKYIAKNTFTDASEKFYISLAKYALRMHNRCTPFGFMAGCGVSQFADKLILNINQFKRDVTLDSACVDHIADSISKDPIVKSKLKFWPNNSIYRIGREIRYTFAEKNGAVTEYELSTINATKYLTDLLSQAKFGITFTDLVFCSTSDGISTEDAKIYIDNLIINQLLISELKPSVIGKKPFDNLIEKLASLDLSDSNKHERIDQLRDIQHLLGELSGKESSFINTYTNISKKLKSLNIPINHDRLLKAELFCNPCPNEENTDLSSLQTNLLNATAILDRLTRRNHSRNLEKFIQKFRDRYEDQEIPLTVALDNDFGLGYGTYNDSYLSPDYTSQHKELTWTDSDNFLLGKLVDSLTTGKKVIQIDLKELDHLASEAKNKPPTMFAHFSYFNNNSKDYNIALKYVGGPSAVNLIGRFGYLKEIHETIAEITDKEDLYHRDCIIAEICHSPQIALGNVLQRTTVRDYEIPYLTPSSLPIDRQIWIDDLFLSIRNDKLHLRSKKLNKEIKPRLSNAHHFSKNNLPIYHFLCDMQFSDQKYPFYFNWGAIAETFEFLPRVQTGSVVLSPAKWQISKKELKELSQEKLSVVNIRSWLKAKNLPDLFYVLEGDSEILIDSSCDLSISILSSMMKGKEKLTMAEYLYADGDSFLKDQDGNQYANELVAFFIINEEKKQTKPQNYSEKQNGITRKFSLGSEWLCYKLYCGNKIADDILIKKLNTIRQKLEKLSLIDKWFFIRYNDTDFHIRFRIHLKDVAFLGEVIRIFNNGIGKDLDNGKIWKIQNETYNRELERYSVKYIHEVESLFHIDSECILNSIRFIPFEHDRFDFALKLIQDVIELFGIDGQSFTEYHKEAFAKEFSRSKYEIDQIYRAKRDHLFKILKDPDQVFSKKIMLAIQDRRKKFTDIISLTSCFKKSNPHRIASSIIHMSVNRIFKDFNRIHESSLYEMLFRYYKSIQFRK